MEEAAGAGRPSRSRGDTAVPCSRTGGSVKPPASPDARRTVPEGSAETDGCTMMEAIASWAACGLVAASAVCDLRTRRIPNAIPLALLGLFVVYAFAGGAGPLGGVWVHFGLGALLLAAGFLLYLTGGFGAGDAKLIAVAGIWSGPGDGLGIFLLGLAACSFVLCLYALLPFDATRRLRRELPFAVAVASPRLWPS